MAFYRQSSGAAAATAATVPTSRSPSWFEAVNSEYFYDQNQIQDMKTNNHQMYATNMAAHSTANVHDQPLTVLTTSEHSHTSIEYYQPPDVQSMHFNNNANYLLQTQLQSQSQPSPLPSLSQPPMYDDGSAMLTYAPCQGPRPWNFAQCYGFYGQPACPLLNIIDMEDFM